MSIARPSTSLLRLTQTLSQRYASTAAPASSYPRKTSTPFRKAPASPTPSRASISSTPAPAAATNDLPPPPPSFEDIAGPARPAASSSKFSRAPPGQSPPAPLTAFPDENYTGLPNVEGADWSTSFSGLSTQPFDEKAAAVLLKPVTPEEIEVKPDGILYMPEIRYRRRLNQAFGPGGWGLAPRGGSHITDRQVTREWGLVCLGRLVAVARGESEYFDQTGIANAHEAAKSNALMRCCKDLGIADSLWDPTFIRKFKAEHVAEVWVAHSTKGNKKKMFRKKTDPKFTGAWKE